MAIFHNRWVRFFGPLAVLAIAAFLLRDKMPFLAEGYDDVRDANNTGLILGFIAVFASIVAMAEVMRGLLHAGGYEIPLAKTLQLTLVGNSWSSTFPGGAAISTVYQYRTMRLWDVSVVVSSWFIIVSGALSTVWLIALGLVSIFFLNASFSLAPLVGSATIMTALAMLVFFATNHPYGTETVLRKLIMGFNRLTRREPTRGLTSLHSQIVQLDAVHLSFGRFAWIAILSLLNWVLDIVSLWLCIWAVTDYLPGFEMQPNRTTVLGVTLAFVTSKIVGTAQVTPAGLGPVEAAMTASLVAVGMTASNAFGAVFVYRILSFALIAGIGWITYFVSVARGGMAMETTTPDKAPNDEAAPETA